MTRTLVIAFVFMIGVPLSFAADDEASKKELAKFEGTWQLESLELHGKAQPVPENAPRWRIKGNQIRYAGEILATLTLDARSTPKSIDLNYANPKKTFEGIYAIDNDTLKLCVNHVTDGVKERPDSFVTEEKENLRLLVFKRIKDAKEGDVEILNGFVGMPIMKKEDSTQIVVLDLLEGSPAKKAGLQKDDILVKVGDAEATDLQTVIALVRKAKPKSDLKLLVKRGDKEKEITVKVGVMPFYYLDF